jgi:hypothetical protein
MMPPPIPPPGLPPQHAQAPLHLPLDAPLELPQLAAVADSTSVDWNAQGHAAVPQGYATGSPGYAGAAVISPPPMPVPIPSTLGGPPPSASSPLRAPYPFNEQHRSESGPAHGALPLGTQPIVRTRQGYANAPTMTRSDPYPRAEAQEQEIDLNISLQPSNRLLYIGLGIVLVGIIVLLAISIAEGPDESPLPAPRPSSLQGASNSGASRPAATVLEPSAAVLTPEPVKPDAFHAEPVPGGGSDPTPPPTNRRESIRVHIVSTPPGAEVSLGGKLLGVTPLDTEIERRTGSDVLTIHRPRYQDVTMTIELGSEITRTVTLAPIPEPVAKPPVDHPVRPVQHERPTGKRPPGSGASKEDECQPPDKINPFELACHGKVCKPCPTPTR